MTGLPDKTLLLPMEVKAFLRVSLATVYRMCDEGELKALKIRGTRRIYRESVMEHVNNAVDE